MARDAKREPVPKRDGGRKAAGTPGARYNLLLDILTSGTNYELGIDERVRLIFTNSVIILGVAIMASFSVINLKQEQWIAAAVVGAFTLANASTFVYLRITRKPTLPSVVCTTNLFLLFTYMTWLGGDNLAGSLWCMSLPLVAVFMNGFRAGFSYSLAMLASFSLIMHLPSLNQGRYGTNFSIRFTGVYILICIFTLVYEFAKNLKDRQIAEKQRTIEQKTEEIELMKDNLDDGIFLVDRELRIQGEYSRSLDGLFRTESLASLNFVDFLSRWLDAEKIQEVVQHMPLVFQRGNDDIVKSLNPLENERFDFDAGGRVERRFLSFRFSKIVKDDKEYVLITVSDVTERVELEERLRHEEEARDIEIDQLLGIIKVGAPGMILNFIGDAEETIDIINRGLKSDENPKALLDRVYGLVHAVKGDAGQLGMTNLSARFHAMEDKLAFLRKYPELKSEDFIPVVVDINDALDEIEKLKDMLQRIRDMQKAESDLNPKTILVEALQRVIRAGAEKKNLGVTLRINRESMDDSLVGGRHRKLVKDVLIQLARNSLAHGIESRAERKRLGKDEKGAISVVVKREDGKLVLLYRDDGKGIDVEAVKNKAADLKLRKAADLAALDDEKACALIFEPGLSTAREVDELSGRGIGMDLVKSLVEEKGGSISVNSVSGKGCLFKVSLPL